jgi:hypothetical protein
MTHSFKALLVVVIFLLVLANTQANVMNLNDHMPTRLDDASVIETDKIEVQASGRYEDDDKRFHFRPGLRWGPVKRVQTELMLDHYSGPDDKETGNGQTSANIQWNFNDQDNIIPALALTSEFNFPTGKNTYGIDPSIKLNMTSTIAGTLADPVSQFHVNYRWLHNSSRRSGEEKVGKLLVAGYSHRVGSQSAVIIDFAHEKDALTRMTTNEVELGWLHEAARQVQVGISAGLDVQEGYFSSTLAIQKGF